MSNWFGKIFEISSKKIPQQIQKTNHIQQVASNIEKKSEPVVKQARNSYSRSLKDQLSYGKWYYGIDENVQPQVKRTFGGIEKIYPCRDGGEVVVNYISRPDKSSSLYITKTGNPNDINKGDWYRGFYSETAVKHYKDAFGDDATKIVKKKGGRKQILSTQNGQATEEVHVPLKRWQRVIETFGINGKKESSFINPNNPKDFDRFCD